MDKSTGCLFIRLSKMVKMRINTTDQIHCSLCFRNDMIAEDERENFFSFFGQRCKNCNYSRCVMGNGYRVVLPLCPYRPWSTPHTSASISVTQPDHSLKYHRIVHLTKIYHDQNFADNFNSATKSLKKFSHVIFSNK